MAKRTTTTKVAAEKAVTIKDDSVVTEKKSAKTTSKATPKTSAKTTAKTKKEEVNTEKKTSKKVAEKPAKKAEKAPSKKVAPIETPDIVVENVKPSPKVKVSPIIPTKISKTNSLGKKNKGAVSTKKEMPSAPEQKILLDLSEQVDEQNVGIDAMSGEQSSQIGEEKLSRKERRLREWRERKKQKKMQSMLERQNQKNNADESAITAEIPEEKPSQDLQEISEQVVEPKAEKSVLKEQKSQPHPGKVQQVVPLDKVGQDFPAPNKVDYGLGGLSKAKVDPLPRELESIVSKTVQFLEREIRIQKPATILCGVSGGIDSVVLLDILAVISTRGWSTIHVAHCNHSLRGEESHQDELFVRRLAGKYGLHFHHTTADVAAYAKEYSLGIELAARTIRYQFFEKAAKGCHADFIATAHNAEDNAETLMMNLMRGSGITGLAGIPPRREIDKKLSLIRPILWLSRKEIERYAKVRKLEWREDETNASTAFTRNKIRHELLPKLREEYSPGLTEVLNRTTTLMREAQEFIAERILTIMQKGIKEINKTSFALQIGLFQSVKDFAKGELIQAALRKHLLMQPIPMNSIDKIIQLASGPAGNQVDINKELVVIREREELVFTKREPHVDIFMPVAKLGTFSISGISYHGEIAEHGTVAFGAHPLIEYFDAALIPDELVIRHWRDGDRMRPLGMNGSMTVSDFLANAKVRVADKRNVFVLCSGEEVYWIVGHRINDQYKVTQATNDILRITVKLTQEKQHVEKTSTPHVKHKPHQNGNRKSPKHLGGDGIDKHVQGKPEAKELAPKEKLVENEPVMQNHPSKKSEKKPIPSKKGKGKPGNRKETI